MAAAAQDQGRVLRAAYTLNNPPICPTDGVHLTELLIIDDFGMKQLSKRSGEFLFEIVMRRYEIRSTMMTTNRPLEDGGKLLSDMPTATAILARFLHHSEILTITGKSYRLSRRGEESNRATAPTGSRDDKNKETTN